MPFDYSRAYSSYLDTSRALTSPHPDAAKAGTIDTSTKELVKWSEEGCSVGEPVFVAAPASQGKVLKEDEGVVLAVILDHLHKDSFLLILDGQTFKEIARAKAPHIIPAGLHGQYFQ